jgi:hypothetical protein
VAQRDERALGGRARAVAIPRPSRRDPAPTQRAKSGRARRHFANFYQLSPVGDVGASVWFSTGRPPTHLPATDRLVVAREVRHSAHRAILTWYQRARWTPFAS